MKRARYHRKKNNHYCILVNKRSVNYSDRHIQKLISQIRKKGAVYSLFEPDNAMDHFKTAQKICGLKKWGKIIPQPFMKRGKVTALIVCGGDSAFNLTARAALKSDIPIGIIPLGKENNIAHALYQTDNIDTVINTVLKNKYRLIDHGLVGEQIFFGSVALGFIPEMSKLLNTVKKPRFAFGFGKLAGKIAESIKARTLLIKINAFRFEISPIILNVQLLPNSAGFNISPVSLFDDGKMEVILDFGLEPKQLVSFTKDILKKRHAYGKDIKLFRTDSLNLQPVKNLDLYLDGEIINLPNDFIDITIGKEKLKVFC